MAPATEPAIRLLVVDDHLMVREGLRSMLSGEEIEIVGEASTGGEAIRIAADLSPEVVLLDLELPDMDGLTVLRQIKEITPALPVLVVTMHDDPALVRRAVRAGAAGYVLKGIGRAELLASVRAVRNGESVLDPGLLRAVVDGDASGEDGATALECRAGPAAPRCRWADQPGDRAASSVEPGHRQEVRAAHPREARRVGSHAGGGGRGAPRPLRVSGPVATWLFRS